MQKYVHLLHPCIVLADDCIVQVERNILHQEFSGEGEDVGLHMWWTVPAQEMLLCSLPGAGGPGGAQPRPRDHREPPTAGGMPEDRLVAHQAT